MLIFEGFLIYVLNLSLVPLLKLSRFHKVSCTLGEECRKLLPYVEHFKMLMISSYLNMFKMDSRYYIRLLRLTFAVKGYLNACIGFIEFISNTLFSIEKPWTIRVDFWAPLKSIYIYSISISMSIFVVYIKVTFNQPGTFPDLPMWIN